MLNNKTILVAGAGGLLGIKVVQHILQERGKVIALDINSDAMKDRLSEVGIDISNKNLQFVSLDLNHEKMVKDFFNLSTEISGAVNCIYPRNSAYGTPFLDISLDSFNENISLNLGSTFLFLQCCATYFKRTDKAFSIVNISSIYGVVAPKFEIYNNTEMTMPIEYAAIKSAIIHLTKYASVYMNNSQFRVNCVSPGGLLDNQPAEFLNAYKAKTNGMGMLQAEEITGTIIFLLSDLSKAITGQNIVVDDGFSL